MRRHDHVVAGFAGEHLGLEHVVGIERVIDHLDAGLLGELIEHLWVDIVRPIIDVDHALLRRGGEHTEHGGSCDRDEEAAHALSPRSFRSADYLGGGMRPATASLPASNRTTTISPESGVIPVTALMLEMCVTSTGSGLVFSVFM